jgi:nucleoid DNA-binding protein
MTKKELTLAIAANLGLPQTLVRDAVQDVFNEIIEALITNGRIELRNFGIFQVKERKARKARNPRTGETVEVPSKYVVTFKPGQEMEERIGKSKAVECAVSQMTAI